MCTRSRRTRTQKRHDIGLGLGETLASLATLGWSYFATGLPSASRSLTVATA